jgi:hypothetical protein
MFEDVTRSTLALERLFDQPLPPSEVPISSSGRLCAESALAEPEVDDRFHGFVPAVSA